MAGAISPSAFPAAAGGVDVATGITSLTPGIRKLKKPGPQSNIPVNGGLVKLDLPKSSYLHKMVVRVTGTLRIIQPASSPFTVTATDPRNFLQSLEFALSGSTSPRKLTGLQEDIIDQLDVAATAPNVQTYSAGPGGAVSSTTDTPFEIQFSPQFVVSDQNLYGIPYLGGNATNPQLLLTFADPNGSLAVPGGALGTGSIQLINGKVETELWRVDLPGPVAPVQTADAHNNPVIIPGQGLYLESGYVLLTRMLDAQDLTAANSNKLFRLPIGPDYLRIILLVFKGATLDDESAPLLDHAELNVQQATGIESKAPWQFTNEFRRTYNKGRPVGVYVFSGVDLTGTDADLYVSRELGNFDLNVFTSNVAPPANSRVQVITQQLVPLSAPGEYL
jgi:hypothetical protein